MDLKKPQDIQEVHPDEASMKEAEEKIESEDVPQPPTDPAAASRQKNKKEKSILKKINLPTCMISKTEVCKHHFGCFENALRGWYRSFILAFVIKSVLLHLPKILRPAKLLQSL